MRRMRFIKEIRGTVYLDSNCNGTRDGTEQTFKDITINLYLVGEVEKPHSEGQDNEIEIYREKLAGSTKTDEKGEYRLLVSEGTYSVNLDVDTLPEGKGVVEVNKLIGIGEQGRVDFPVRDVADVELDKTFEGSVSIDDSIVLNPVCKDKMGNVISAKINYSSDDEEIDTRSGLCSVEHKHFSDKKISISLNAGNVKTSHTINVKIPEVCSTDRVNIAHRLGIIDEHTKMLYYLRSLFANERLPREYRSRVPIKSGTRAVEEVKRYIQRDDADRDIVEKAIRYLSSSVPRLDQVYTSPSGYFKIHYTTTGLNAVAARGWMRNTVPQYIQLIGAAFDNVKAVTCGSRGFRVPLLDEGKESYDVYVYDLKGKYGVTYSSNYFYDLRSNIRRASSYICIDNNYSASKGFDKSRDDCMRVTAAHEFFHAVQYAYNVDADTWWKEASATWNEDELYTGVNDYIRYIGNYFASPQKTLEESSYGGVIFAKYLTENYGGYSMMKRIWEIQSAYYSNSVNAIDRAIQEATAKEDIGAVFDRFTAYNFNPAQYYREGSLWKSTVAIQKNYSTYPVSTARGSIDHLASNYVIFKPSSSIEGKTLRIAIDGADRVRWGFKVQQRSTGDNKCTLTDIASNGIYNRAEVLINGLGADYKEVCLIPANLDKERDRLSYTYSAAVQ